MWYFLRKYKALYELRGKESGCHLHFTETSDIKCGGGWSSWKGLTHERVLKGLWGNTAERLMGETRVPGGFSQSFPDFLVEP